MSTHNLCFGAKIRKIGIPLRTPVLLYKSGIQGVYITWTCFPDGCYCLQFKYSCPFHNHKFGSAITPKVFSLTLHKVLEN